MIDATSWHLNNFNQLAAVVAGIAETGIEESSMVAGVRKSPKRCGVDRAKDQVRWNRIKFKRKQTQPERVCGQYVDPSRQTSQVDLIQNSLTRKGGLSWIKSWKTTYFRIVTGRWKTSREEGHPHGHTFSPRPFPRVLCLAWSARHTGDWHRRLWHWHRHRWHREEQRRCRHLLRCRSEEALPGYKTPLEVQTRHTIPVFLLVSVWINCAIVQRGIELYRGCRKRSARSPKAAYR